MTLVEVAEKVLPQHIACTKDQAATWRKDDDATCLPDSNVGAHFDFSLCDKRSGCERGLWRRALDRLGFPGIELYQTTRTG